MLSVIKNVNANGQANEDGESYIFTCYNGLLGLLFTEVLHGLKNAKLSLERIENMVIQEPMDNLVDGCYYHLKNTFVPLTMEQKRFFLSHHPAEKKAMLFSDERIAEMIAMAGRVMKD